MKKYGYFGSGLEGYMHYMQSFEDTTSKKDDCLYDYGSDLDDTDAFPDSLFSDDDIGDDFDF